MSEALVSHAEALSTLYVPASSDSLVEWAEKNILIPDRESTEFGGSQYELKKAPYQKIILDWFQQEGAHEMIINKSSRAGVSFCALIPMAHAVKEKAKNILYVLDEEDTAARMNNKRFQPILKESGLLKGMGIRPTDFQKKLLTFPKMLIHFLSAGAEGTFDEKEVDIVILDEMRNYKISNAIHQARQRLKNKKTSKLLAFSEPTTEDSEQEQEWKTSSQEEILLSCPHCGEMNHMVKEQLIFSHCKRKDKTYDIERVKEEVFYQCSSDQRCKIYEHQRIKMWDHYELRVRNPDHHYNKRGLQINDLHSLFVPFWKTAKAWIESAGKPLLKEKLDTASFAKVPKMRHGEISHDDIYSLQHPGGFGRWECPFNEKDVSLVCQIIDTQLKTFKTVVLVFDRKSNYSVASWGEFESLDEARDWGDGSITTKDGKVVNRFAGVVDEGDGNRVNEVREWCADNHAEGWMPIRGLSNRQVMGPWAESEVPVEGYVEEITVLQIPENRYKYALVYTDILGHKKSLSIGAPVLWLPTPIDDAFRDELRNEFIRKKNVTRGGGEKGNEWHKAGPNDYLDCIKYGKGLLSYMRDRLIAEGFLDE